MDHHTLFNSRRYFRQLYLLFDGILVREAITFVKGPAELLGRWRQLLGLLHHSRRNRCVHRVLLPAGAARTWYLVDQVVHLFHVAACIEGLIHHRWILFLSHHGCERRGASLKQPIALVWWNLEAMGHVPETSTHGLYVFFSNYQRSRAVRLTVGFSPFVSTTRR